MAGIMSGMVIAFPGTETGSRRKARTKRAGSRTPRLEARVERISALLEELEDISSPSVELSTMLARARASMHQVEARLRGRARDLTATPAAADDEGEPQPDLAHEVLDRHFHSSHVLPTTVGPSAPKGLGDARGMEGRSRGECSVEPPETASDLRETARRIRELALVEAGDERRRLLAYASELDEAATSRD